MAGIEIDASLKIVDVLKEIKKLQKTIASVKTEAITISTLPDIKGFRRELAKLRREAIAQSVVIPIRGQLDISDEVVVKLNIDGTLSKQIDLATQNLSNNIVTAIDTGFKQASSGNIFTGLIKGIAGFGSALIGGLFSTIGTLFSGAILGLTLPLGEKLGKGLVSGLEKELSDIIGSFDLVGKKIGSGLIDELLKEISASTVDLRKIFESFIPSLEISTESANIRQQSEASDREKLQIAEQQLASEQQRIKRQKRLFIARDKAIKDVVSEFEALRAKVSKSISDFEASAGTPALASKIEQEKSNLNRQSQLLKRQQKKPAELKTEKDQNIEKLLVKQIEKSSRAIQSFYSQIKQIDNLVKQQFRKELSQIDAIEKVIIQAVSRFEKELGRVDERVAIIPVGKEADKKGVVKFDQDKTVNELLLLYEEIKKVDQDLKRKDVIAKRVAIAQKEFQLQIEIMMRQEQQQKLLKALLQQADSLTQVKNTKNFEKLVKLVYELSNIKAEDVSKPAPTASYTTGEPLEKFLDKGDFAALDSEINSIVIDPRLIAGLNKQIDLSQEQIIFGLGSVIGQVRKQAISNLKDVDITKLKLTDLPDDLLKMTQQELDLFGHKLDNFVAQATSKGVDAEVARAIEEDAIAFQFRYATAIASSFKLLDQDFNLDFYFRQIQDLIGKTGNTQLETILKTVAAESSFDLSELGDILPDFVLPVESMLLQMAKNGIHAAYDFVNKQVVLGEDTFSKLSQGISLKDFEVQGLAHEIRHAMQTAFGQLSYADMEAGNFGVELLTATQEELKIVGKYIEGSVKGAIDQGSDLSEDVLRLIEEDAYVFQLRIAQKLKDALSEVIDVDDSSKIDIPSIDTEPTQEIEENIKQAVSAYEILFEEVVKASNLKEQLEFLVGSIPSLQSVSQSQLESNPDIQGSYDRLFNVIRLRPEAIASLEKDLVDFDLISYLSHEIRHGLQAMFGTIADADLRKGLAGVDLLSPTKEELELFGKALETSISNFDPDKQDIGKVMEEDAYSFQNRFAETIYNNVKTRLEQAGKVADEIEKEVSSPKENISIPDIKKEAIKFNQNISRVEQIYKYLFKAVAQFSDFELYPTDELPKLEISKTLPKEAIGQYSQKNNQVNVSAKIARLLDLNLITDEVIEVLVHEIRHAFQAELGNLTLSDQLEGGYGVDLIQPTEEEFEKLSTQMAKSVQTSLNSLKEMGVSDKAIADAKTILLATEKDAYAFTERFYRQIFKGLQESLQSAATFDIGSLQSLSREEITKLFDSEEFSAKGLRELVKRLGISASVYKNAKKTELAGILANLNDRGRGEDIRSESNRLGDRIRNKKYQKGIATQLPTIDEEKYLQDNAKFLSNITEMLELIKNKAPQVPERLNELLNIPLKKVNERLDELRKVASVNDISDKNRQALGGYQAQLNYFRESLVETILQQQQGVTGSALEKLATIETGVFDNLDIKQFSIKSEDNNDLEKLFQDLNNLDISSFMFSSDKDPWLDNDPWLDTEEAIAQVGYRLEDLQTVSDDPWANISPDLWEETEEAIAQVGYRLEDLQTASDDPWANISPDPWEETEEAIAQVGYRLEDLQTVSDDPWANISPDPWLDTEEAIAQVGYRLEDLQTASDDPWANISPDPWEETEEAVNQLNEAVDNLDDSQPPELEVDTENLEDTEQEVQGFFDSLKQQIGNAVNSLKNLFAGNVDSDELQNEFRSAQLDAEEAIANIETNLARVDQAVDDSQRQLERATDNTTDAINGFENAPETLMSKFKRLFKIVTKELGNIDGLTRKVAGAFKFLLAGILAVKAIEVIQEKFAEFTETLEETIIRFDDLKESMTFLEGSPQKAAKRIAFLRDEAEKLKVPFLEAAEGFKTLGAAAKGTELEKMTKEIYSSVLQAGRVFQLPKEDIGGTFKALEQMIGKGTVQAEELRGQLGDRLPGAFQIAARSMGVTTKELGKLLETGQVTSEEFIPKFVRQLASETREGVKGAVDTLSASITGLENKIVDLQIKIGETFNLVENKSRGIELMTFILTAIEKILPLIALSIKAIVGFGLIKFLAIAKVEVKKLGVGFKNLAINIASGVPATMQFKRTLVQLRKIARTLRTVFKGLIVMEAISLAIDTFNRLKTGIESAKDGLEDIKQSYLDFQKILAENNPENELTIEDIVKKNIEAIKENRNWYMKLTDAAKEYLREKNKQTYVDGSEMPDFLGKTWTEGQIDQASERLTETIAYANSNFANLGIDIGGIEAAETDNIRNAVQLLERDLSSLRSQTSTTVEEEKRRNAQIALQKERIEILNEELKRRFNLEKSLADVVLRRDRVFLEATEAEAAALAKIDEETLESGDLHRDVELLKLAETKKRVEAQYQAEKFSYEEFSQIIKSRNEKALSEGQAELNKEYKKGVITLTSYKKALKELEDKYVGLDIDTGLPKELTEDELKKYKELRDGVRTLRGEMLKTNVDFAKEEVETQLRIYDRYLEEIEDRRQEAEDLTIESEKQRLIEIQQLVNDDVISTEQAEKLKANATYDRIRDELDQEKRKFYELQDFKTDSVEAQEKADNDIKASRQKILDLTLQLLQEEQQAEERVTNAIAQSRDNLFAKMEQRLSRIQQLYSLQSQLEGDRTTSQDKLADLELSRLKQALAIRQQINSGDLDKHERKAAIKQLYSLGIKGRTDEISLLNKIESKEEKIAKAKMANLERQHELARANLEIENQRFELETRKAKLEADREQRQAEQKVLDADTAITEAEQAVANATTEEELEIANQQLDSAYELYDIAQLGLKLANQEQAAANQQLDNLDAIIAKKRENLELSQAIAEAELEGTNLDQLFERDKAFNQAFEAQDRRKAETLTGKKREKLLKPYETNQEKIDRKTEKEVNKLVEQQKRRLGDSFTSEDESKLREKEAAKIKARLTRQFNKKEGKQENKVTRSLFGSPGFSIEAPPEILNAIKNGKPFVVPVIPEVKSNIPLEVQTIGETKGSLDSSSLILNTLKNIEQNFKQPTVVNVTNDNQFVNQYQKDNMDQILRKTRSDLVEVIKTVGNDFS